MSNHLSGTTIGTVRRRRSGRGTRRTTQVFEIFIWIQNEWMDFGLGSSTSFVWIFFSPKTQNGSIFSVLAPAQQWRSVPNFYFLSFVVCLLSSRPDPRPRGGSLSVDGGVPGPSNSLFVCFLHPPTHTHTHPHVITVHWPRYHWRHFLKCELLYPSKNFTFIYWQFKRHLKRNRVNALWEFLAIKRALEFLDQ